MSGTINLTCVENAKVRNKALAWYRQSAFGPIGRLVLWVWTITVIFLMFIGAARIADFLNWLADSPMPEPVAPLVGVILVGIAYQAWCSYSVERALRKHFISGKGLLTYSFDAVGMTLQDDVHNWNSQWTYVSDIANTRHGLFLATQGSVFFLPNDSWSSNEAKNQDYERVVSWWQDASGQGA